MMLRTLILLLVATPAAAQDAYYRLDPVELSCIVENIDAYRAMQSDPLFIVTADCPPSGTVSLFGSLINELPDHEIDDNGFDGFLALTRGNVECIAGLDVPETSTAVRLFLDECRLVVE